MDKIKEFLEVFEHLPPSWIAHFLRKEGIQGRRKSGCFCPIAKYLKRRGIQVVGVRHVYIAYEDDEEIKYYNLPPNITQFIEEFDDGEYPALEGK